MSNIKAMRERRNALAMQARKLMDETKDKAWSADHQTQYDTVTAELDDIDTRITRHQAMLDRTAEERLDDDTVERVIQGRQPSEAKAIVQAWLRKGDNGLTAEQLVTISNTMSTTTDAEGGFTVPKEIAATVIDALKAYGGMRSVSSLLVTSTGRPLNYPTSDGTAEEGEIIAENQTATDADVTFGTVSLTAYKYSSKVITVPMELLMDSAVDVEAFVRGRIGDRIGRITNKHFTTGTGTSQPNGVVTASSVGKVGANGQTASVTYDDLADLVESVDEAYLEGGNCRFMFHQQMRRVIRKLKDTTGRPIWTPGYEVGISAGVPDLLLGYEIKINNHMPIPAANAKSIVFGDFKKYQIRDVMEMSLLRFTDSVYAKKGQVGFLAWMRAGGNLLDTAAMKAYQNSAT
ncbi:MAG: phage major capsid protein [Pseudomonadota bacterium]